MSLWIFYNFGSVFVLHARNFFNLIDETSDSLGRDRKDYIFEKLIY